MSAGEYEKTKKKKKTFDQHKSRLTEFETAVFFRRRRPRPERFGCGVPAAAAHPLKCSSGLPSSPPPPMRVCGRMRWWGMRKVARWNGHRGARSTVVSSEFVSRQTVGRSSRRAAHVNTPPTDCHVFNNVTSIVFSVRQSFPGVFFPPRPVPAARRDMRSSWLRVSVACVAVVAMVSAANQPQQSNQAETLPNGLKIEYVYTLDGCEPKSKINDMLTMHYTGKLVDGTKFDSR